MIKFMKKNKFTTVAIVFFILFFILILGTKNLFFPNAGTAIYGDRLADLKEITKDEKENVQNKLKENDEVVDAKVEVKGKIVKTFITVKDEVELKKAKEIGNQVKNNLTEETLKNYDLSIYISKENKELNNFPIAGTKHIKDDNISWSKDREITTSEGEE